MNTAAVALSEYDHDDYEDEAPPSKTVKIDENLLSHDDREWIESLCMTYLNMNREGATFLRLAKDVFVIGVYGGQLIHNDRHLAWMADTEGFSDHTWNMVVTPSEGQMLLTEDQDRIFKHHRLDDLGQMIYMNTKHHHLVSRENEDDVIILIQADGYDPDHHEQALEAIVNACKARQFQGMI